MNEQTKLKFKGIIDLSMVAILFIGVGIGIFTYNRYSGQIKNEMAQDNAVLQAKATSSTLVNNTKPVSYSSNNPLNQTQGFFKKFGLSIAGILNIQEITLPKSFESNEGELPIGLYWAYCNELSKSLGMDFSSYKGKVVKDYTILVKDNNNFEKNAAVLICDDKIVGSWLINAKTLDQKSFKDVVSKAWSQWVKDNGIENYNSNFNKELKKLSGEEIIRRYCQCINNKDYKGAFMLLSTYSQSETIFKMISNSTFDSGTLEPSKLPLFMFQDIKIINISEEKNPQDIPLFSYNSDVNIDSFQSKKFVFCASVKPAENKAEAVNSVTYEMYVVKESPDAPWKIQVVGF